jgi:phosphoribosyl-AMP cyclohydrolase
MSSGREETSELMLDFERRGGLLPAIVQDASSKEVLMLGYVNQPALDEALRSGYATFWSTSRGELWTKGKTSGDLLKVKEVLTDCDQDAIIYMVERIGGGTCHTVGRDGKHRRSCFYRRLKGEKLEFIEESE